MSGDNRPSLVAGAAMGGVVTSLLAGPLFVWIAIVVLAVENGVMPNGPRLFDTVMVFSLYAVVVGLAGAVPAAIINSLVTAMLAKRQMDGPFPASISGAICGVIVAPAGLHLLVWKKYAGYWGGDDGGRLILCLAVAGGLAGFIHWLIAIRPYRRWRHHWVRAIEARAMEFPDSTLD